MKSKCLLAAILTLVAVTGYTENIFPIGAIISGSENGQLLDTVKAGGLS